MVTINAVSPSVVHAGATAIAAGDEHSMVLKQDGTVWATGKNKYGQLGDGTTTGRVNLVKVVSSGHFATISLTHTAVPAITCTLHFYHHTAKQSFAQFPTYLCVAYACTCILTLTLTLTVTLNTHLQCYSYPHLRLHARP